MPLTDLVRESPSKFQDDTPRKFVAKGSVFYSMMCLLFLIFTTVSVSIRYCFVASTPGLLLAFDVLADLFSIVDVYVRSNSLGARAYLSSLLFVIDLLSLFPADFVVLILGYDYHAYASLRLLRLLRCLWFPRYMLDIEHYVVLNFHAVTIGHFRMIKLFSLMGLSGHLAGCCFYFIAWNEADTYGISKTWPEADGLWTLDVSSGVVTIHVDLYTR